jgi:hypothetical protein|tara:strand:+ start:129 stop:260 length:132 start_codon:yes stop_codon:yes gene_type:complete
MYAPKIIGKILNIRKVRVKKEINTYPDQSIDLNMFFYKIKKVA